MTLPCPQCQSPLDTITVADVELNWCARTCKGIWFDQQELAQLNTTVAREDLDAIFLTNPNTATQAPASNDKLCPVDGVVMHRYEWNLTSGIQLDSCRQCRGIWLDGGEVNRFFDAVAAAREPHEIPDELRWKMAANDAMIGREMNAMEKTATKTAIDWNLGPLDDLLRAIVGLVMPD